MTEEEEQRALNQAEIVHASMCALGLLVVQAGGSLTLDKMALAGLTGTLRVDALDDTVVFSYESQRLN